MDPRALGSPDGLLQDVYEGSDIVICDSFALRHAPNELRIYPRRSGTARPCIFWRDDAELGPCLDGQEFDLEPYSESGFLGEDTCHLGH